MLSTRSFSKLFVWVESRESVFLRYFTLHGSQSLNEVEGMFAEVCARMFSKSPSSFQVVRWFPVTAESFEDVHSTMDIIEGPVYFRRRKKVRYVLINVDVLLRELIVAFSNLCSGRPDGQY